MRTPSGAADSQETRLLLGCDLIGIVQHILQESADPETLFSSLSAAFSAQVTIKGQAAEVPAGASAAAKCFVKLFVDLPTEDD